MKNLPLVSIVVPCYNQAEYLPITLKSVFKQNFVNWECIIVNDGSSDNTEQIADEWVKEDSRFRYFYKNNQGLVEARNSGINIALGKYILPLDSDDLIHKNYLAEAVKIIELNKKMNIVYSDTRLFGIRKGVWTTSFDKNEFMFRNLIPCTALFLKKDWQESGGYNSNMEKGFEDWDFWMSIIAKGGSVYKIPKQLFFYRQRINSMIAKLTENDVKKLKKRIALNHLSFYAEQLGDPLTLSLEIIELKRQKLLIENSWAYRVGCLIVNPLKFLKKIKNQ